MRVPAAAAVVAMVVVVVVVVVVVALAAAAPVARPSCGARTRPPCSLAWPG
jgi:hypothetical protein